MLKWSNDIQEVEIISRIAGRYIECCNELQIPVKEKLRIIMDIEAVHCNGNPLKLADLLAAPMSDFLHDMAGIQSHLDRATGKLVSCFSPRYSH